MTLFFIAIAMVMEKKDKAKECRRMKKLAEVQLPLLFFFGFLLTDVLSRALC